jgi:hypothetical protein
MVDRSSFDNPGNALQPEELQTSTQKRIGEEWRRFLSRPEVQMFQPREWLLHRSQDFSKCQLGDTCEVDSTHTTIAVLEYGNHQGTR